MVGWLMRTSTTHRIFFVWIAGWMSICLFLAGAMSISAPMWKQTWVMTGAVGIIACLGWGNLLAQESKFNSKVIKDYEIQSLTDPLTNLSNRRGFDIHLNDLISCEKKRKSRSSDRVIFLALLDVDHFKTVNDSNGHPIGDRMLEYVANTIYSCMPERCLASRLGGDEFAIVYVDAPPELVVWSLKTIKSTIDQESFDRPDLVHTTVSVGLSNYHPLDDVDRLFDRADRALYKTKTAGRNKITFS